MTMRFSEAPGHFGGAIGDGVVGVVEEVLEGLAEAGGSAGRR